MGVFLTNVDFVAKTQRLVLNQVISAFPKGEPPDTAVKLLPCDHEVTDSSPGNSLLQ